MSNKNTNEECQCKNCCDEEETRNLKSFLRKIINLKALTVGCIVVLLVISGLWTCDNDDQESPAEIKNISAGKSSSL